MPPFHLNEKEKIPAGFTVPENYFEQFQANLRLEENVPKVIPFFAKTKVWISAIAAIFVVGLAVIVFEFYAPEKTELDTQTAENYLLHETDLNTYELAEYLNESEINHLHVDLKSAPKLTNP